MLETQPQTPETVPAGESEAVPLVTLSDAAVAKLTELTKDEPDAAVGLRIYVYSGGCSGYRYGMMLEDKPADVGPTATSASSMAMMVANATVRGTARGMAEACSQQTVEPTTRAYGIALERTAPARTPGCGACPILTVRVGFNRGPHESPSV